MSTNSILNSLKYSKENSIIDLLKFIHIDYVNNRYTFIEGIHMERILKFLGATDNDLLKLQHCGDNLSKDPTLPFRKSRNGRFCINYKENSISRLEFQPFVLSKEEDFIRDDSGQLRNFRGIQDDIQENTAFQALIRFQSYIINGIEIKERSNLVDSFDKWVSTIFQLRTITNKTMIGEPAKEGVHSDGVEHTMTTLMKSRNMTAESAISKMHTNEQKTGTPWDKVDDKFVVGKKRHSHFLDTLLIVDTELKHSVSSVECIEKDKEAIRDMIILFTRRPKNKFHSTYLYDSLNPHKEMPLNIPLTKNN